MIANGRVAHSSRGSGCLLNLALCLLRLVVGLTLGIVTKAALLLDFWLHSPIYGVGILRAKGVGRKECWSLDIAQSLDGEMKQADGGLGTSVSHRLSLGFGLVLGVVARLRDGS